MNNFFNIDNGFFTFLGKVCDMLFVSIIWSLVCIPIVTIGPANTAMYYATVKVIRRDRGYLTREFLKSFKLNFKRGAVIGLIFTAIFAILAFDLFTAYTSLSGSTSSNSIFFGIYLAILCFVLCISIYVYPILSRFDMKIGQIFKAALYMAMRHLPFTVCMLVVQAAGIVGVFFMPILIFIIPGAVTFVNSLLMERILKKYMTKPEDSGQDSSRDEWYLE